MWTDVLACAAHNHVDSVLGPPLKSLYNSIAGEPEGC